MNDKKINEILEQKYLTAYDLMIIMPSLKYVTALKYISDAQKEMESKNFFVPECRPKMALTNIVRKRFGF